MGDQREGRAFEQLRWLELHRYAAPDQLHQLQHDVRQAEGHEQLGHMAVRVNLAKAQSLEQCATSTHQQGRDDQGGPETDQAGQRVAEIGPDHVEAGMGKVEHAHHGKNEREAGAEHEQQQPIAHPIEHGDEEKLHREQPSWPRSAGTAQKKGSKKATVR